MAVRLLLNGFTQSVVNEVASVVFKPYGKNTDTLNHEKTLGKKAAHSR